MRRQNPLALGVAIAALALSIYSVYQVSTMQAGGGEGDFADRVYDVIDDYIAEKSGQAPRPSEPVEVSIDDDAMKGDPDAPVTIIEFSDYECPFCGRFFRDTLPQIQEKYIDTGKVRYVFRDFPLSFHANATPAANAAECVREQGGDDMYYEYHDILFENQSSLGADKLKEYAAGLDLDQAELANCIDEGRYNDEVDADFKEGQSYGVSGTPGFFINGVQISGAQPYSVFEAAIEDALNQ